MDSNILKRKVLIEKTFNIPFVSREEFEKYLKSIDGLTSAYPYKGNSNDFPTIDSPDFFCVGEGWFGILKNIIKESIAAGWDKKIHQSKEKYGGLRFYTGNAPEEVHSIIKKYCSLSNITCEECGKPGKSRDGGWIKTLCDTHYELSSI
jgi:hypothetical protein